MAAVCGSVRQLCTALRQLCTALAAVYGSVRQLCTTPCGSSGRLRAAALYGPVWQLSAAPCSSSLRLRAAPLYGSAAALYLYGSVWQLCTRNAEEKAGCFTRNKREAWWKRAETIREIYQSYGSRTKNTQNVRIKCESLTTARDARGRRDNTRGTYGKRKTVLQMSEKLADSDNPQNTLPFRFHAFGRQSSQLNGTDTDNLLRRRRRYIEACRDTMDELQYFTCRNDRGPHELRCRPSACGTGRAATRQAWWGMKFVFTGVHAREEWILAGNQPFT